MTNERINQALLDMIDPAIRREWPPCSKRRNIATTFAHIHNVRSMRLKMSAKDAPARLDRAEVTPAAARELGSPITHEQQFVLWDWRKRAKEAGR